jgi:flagellar hook-length control protein FliK
MQSNALNVLAAVGPNAAANAGAASAGAAGDDTSSGQPFSQLLSDFGAESNNEGAQQFARAQWVQPAAVGAIAAQELAMNPTDGLSEALGTTDRLISPEEATTLIVRIDQMIRRGNDKADLQALTQIKEQLQGIVRDGEPKSVAALMQASPAAKESKLSLLGLLALFANRKPQANTSKEEAPTQAANALQNVSAAIFRPIDGEVATAAPSATEETQTLTAPTSVDAVTIITPLAATMVAAMPAPIADTLDQAANNARSLEQRMADLNAAIAPLALNEPKTLPEVDLPSLSGDLSTQNASQSLADSTSKQAPVIAISDKNLASFASLLNPTPASGMLLPQTAQTPQAVTLVPTHGYLNQAPVTDQVKVAVHQAANDGLGRITIQLDPVDLGRVEVNMQTNREGVTSISFMVDKPETFDSLTRDARFLERALLEVGIKSDTGNMQFNLRQPPQPQLHSNLGGQGQQHQPNPQQEQGASESSNEIAPVTMMPTTQHYTLGVREGVDISA